MHGSGNSQETESDGGQFPLYKGQAPGAQLSLGAFLPWRALSLDRRLRDRSPGPSSGSTGSGVNDQPRCLPSKSDGKSSSMLVMRDVFDGLIEASFTIGRAPFLDICSGHEV